ncbi:PleD family two-component system response regulator [Paraburkholderia sp. Cpub6]|uniref:response regulator n=1 Tax=Paraburkholderia sp. Cpub6 TaxID=2723094 RepID=UPI0017CD207D|nr:response regulator [Paraburkholderia sp. Cpub6]MBB5463060.1 CheY-like chemotaxis protein [Paraburkholderia sp. Cpub6]
MRAGNPRHYPRNCRSWNISCETLIRQESKFRPQNMMYSILLVDDEPEILAAWRLILESEGYEVSCASNGAEALACVVAHVPDLIVTDWMMPVMDGAELCRRLKSMPLSVNVPILVHTAVPPSDSDAHYCSACLLKPIGADLFLTTIAQLCAQRS